MPLKNAPLYGYIWKIADSAHEQVLMSTEQIPAFIMANASAARILVTTPLDERILDAYCGYVGTCTDRDYLFTELMPVLIPMQQGEVKPPEFKPLTEEEWVKLATGGAV